MTGRRRLATRGDRGLGKRSLLVVLAALLALAACGQHESGASAGSGDSEASIDAARALVEEHLGVPEFSAPGPAFDVTGAKGKTVFNIPLSSSIAALSDISKSLEEVATSQGLRFVDYANQGQPSQWVQGIQQAIAQKADVINLLGAPDPALLQPQLAEARKAGIPVIVSHLFPEGTKPPENVTAVVNIPSHDQLARVADYAVWKAEGKVNALIVTSDDVSVSKGIREAFSKELTKQCPSCKVSIFNTTIAQWATGIQSGVETQLTRDPSINFVVPIYDGMAPFVVAAVTARNATDRVQVLTSDGTPAVMKEISGGKVALDVGRSLSWVAYANLDQIMRVLVGEPPLDSEQIPFRMWTSENVAEAGSPPKVDAGYGSSFVEGYQQLWSQ